MLCAPAWPAAAKPPALAALSPAAELRTLCSLQSGATRRTQLVARGALPKATSWALGQALAWPTGHPRPPAAPAPLASAVRQPHPSDLHVHQFHGCGGEWLLRDGAACAAIGSLADAAGCAAAEEGLPCSLYQAVHPGPFTGTAFVPPCPAAGAACLSSPCAATRPSPARRRAAASLVMRRRLLLSTTPCATSSPRLPPCAWDRPLERRPCCWRRASRGGEPRCRPPPS